MRAAWVASIAIVLAGCRFGFDELTGSEIDGDDDVITMPPVSGIARVLVIGEDGEPNAGLPVSGAYVVAIEQDGTTTTVRSKENGMAEVEILGNTSVHVAQRLADGAWALSSFRAINDGAVITVGGHPMQATSAARMVTLNLPPFPATYDQVWITGPVKCLKEVAWAMSTTVPVFYDPQCENQFVDLYALAGDIHIPLDNVKLIDGGSVDLTSRTWTDLEKVGIEYINVPAEVTSTYAVLSYRTASGDSIPVGESSGEPDGDRYVGLGFDIPPIIAPMSIIHAFLSPTGVRVLYDQLDGWPGELAVDAAILPPPPPATTIVPGTSQVQWTAGAAGEADAYWSSTTFTTESTEVRWNAFGPPGATQVTFPQLPADLADLVPTATSEWSTPRIAFAALSDFTYDSVLEIIDRDIYWWWAMGVHLPPGGVSLTSTEIP